MPMSQELNDRLEGAVTRGMSARSRFYASIELEDEQSLGPPASAEDIRRLEEACRHELPPSYRSFLAKHDGWSMIDGGCDLLPVAELLSGATAERIGRWQASMAKEGETALASGLVIGYSAISQKRVVLDFSHQDSDGECSVVQWDSDERIEYQSFIGWLEATAQEFDDLANSPANSDET
jgi:hypothetical protein